MIVLLLLVRCQVVSEGTRNVAPGQPLAIIVPTEAEAEQLVQALKENPRCIEGTCYRCVPMCDNSCRLVLR